MSTISTTKTPTEKSKKKSPFDAGKEVKAKSPAEKFYPTGIVCKRGGCTKIGIGDEYCSTVCAKEDNGVEFVIAPEPLFSKSRLGKPRGGTTLGTDKEAT